MSRWSSRSLVAVAVMTMAAWTGGCGDLTGTDVDVYGSYALENPSAHTETHQGVRRDVLQGTLSMNTGDTYREVYSYRFTDTTTGEVWTGSFVDEGTFRLDGTSLDFHSTTLNVSYAGSISGSTLTYTAGGKQYVWKASS